MNGETRRRHGFSLIEIMITMAILGILASMAVPSYLRMQLRASAAEGRSNLAAIRTAEEAFLGEYGSYAAATPTPAGIPGRDKVAWPAVSGFDLVGWTPDGEVHFQYSVTINAVGSDDAYTAEARSDIDADGVFNVWGYVKQDSVGAGVVGGMGCLGTGVWDAFSAVAILTETVGPCDALSGLMVF